MTGNNFLVPIQNKLPQEFRDMAAYQQANKIYNVDHADEINNNINIYALHEATFPKHSMDTKYYNLFIVYERNKMLTSQFVISKNVSLKRGTSREIRDELFAMDENAQQRIMSFPAIFTTTNSQQGKTDADHHAIFGRVENIEDDGENFVISWGCIRFWDKRNKVPTILQMDLIKNANIFGLGVAPCSNELDDVHWAIKKLNVIDALSKIGIDPMIF